MLTSPVVARIRPLLGKEELEKDTIVRAESSVEGKPANIVRIPNPKNEAEEFSFTFNGVYDMGTTQEDLFTHEGTRIDPLRTHTLTMTSCAAPEIAVPGLGRYGICLWRYGDGENTYDAGRTEAFG